MSNRYRAESGLHTILEFCYTLSVPRRVSDFYTVSSC